MIILRPWTHYRAFIVIVILVTHVPIQPVMQLNREPRFRRLVTHRIRRDQRSGIARRVSNSISLTVVLIDSICREQRRAWSDPRHRLYKEEIVSHDIQAVAQRMPHAVEEIVDNGFAVYPMIIVASAHREPRRRGPIQ